MSNSISSGDGATHHVFYKRFRKINKVSENEVWRYNCYPLPYPRQQQKSFIGEGYHTNDVQFKSRCIFKYKLNKIPDYWWDNRRAMTEPNIEDNKII